MINKTLTKTKLLNPINQKAIKRNMLRGVSHMISKPCKIVQPTPFNHTIKRNLPDQGYAGYKVKSSISGKNPKTGHNVYETEAVDAKGQELPQHEKSHYLVRDKETGKDVALLTSAKDPKKGNEYLAPENVKGHKLPDGTYKPQMIRALDKPRYSVDNTEFVEDPDATALLKKYETETNNFVKKTGTYKKIPIYRTTKDSPTLYHPDGRPIFDKNGNEIDYDN